MAVKVQNSRSIFLTTFASVSTQSIGVTSPYKHCSMTQTIFIQRLVSLVVSDARVKFLDKKAALIWTTGQMLKKVKSLDYTAIK